MRRFCLLLCVLCMLSCSGVVRAGWFFPSSSSPPLPSSADADEAANEYDRLTAHAPGLSAAYAGRQLAESHVRAEALWSKVEQRGEHSHCWKAALQALRQDCAAIQKQDSLRSRLALALASCDEESDGRTHTTFLCSARREVRSCVGGLSELGYSTFLQYRLHVDVLCGYLQEELAQQRTEAAVHALHSQTEQTVDSLHELEKTEQSILHGMNEHQQAQATSLRMTQGLHEALRELGATQQTTLQTLRSSAQEVQASAERAGGALQTLQDTLQRSTASAAQSVEQLQSHVLAQYAAMEEHSAGLLHVLRRIESVQQLIASRTVSLHDVGLVMLSVAVVWLVSGTPRTAAARLPALLCILAGCAAPAALRLLLSLTSYHDRSSGRREARARLLAMLARLQPPWLRVSIALAFGIVCYVAAHHTAPHVLQRRLLREELALALQQHQRRMMRWLEQRGVVEGGAAAKCEDDFSLLCDPALREDEQSHYPGAEEDTPYRDEGARVLSAEGTPRLAITSTASQSRCLTFGPGPAAVRHRPSSSLAPSPWAFSTGRRDVCDDTQGETASAARRCNASPAVDTPSPAAVSAVMPSPALPHSVPEEIDKENGAQDRAATAGAAAPAATTHSAAAVAAVAVGRRVPCGAAKRSRSTHAPACRRRRRDA